MCELIFIISLYAAPYSTPAISNNDKSNITPVMIYSISAGACLLAVLTTVVIVMLVYCRTRIVRHSAQTVSYNKLINS